MRKALYAAAALALIAPSAASADWQYTRWGMSPAEVVAASQGRASPVRGRPGQRVFDLDLRATAAYAANSLTFVAEFFFTQGSGRLAAVKLVPTCEAMCDVLRSELEATYGEAEPQRFAFGMTQRWTDQDHGNRLLFADIAVRGTPRLCHVIYQPIRSEGTGL